MKEERRQILQMVADGKVTAEEGERLLEALEEGERRSKPPSGGGRDTKRRTRKSMRSGPMGGMEGFREIGKMVRGIVMDSIRMDEDEFASDETGPEDEAVLLEDPVELESGTRLAVRRDHSGKRGGSLLLTGSGGSALQRLGDAPPEVRMYSDGETVNLRWSEGDLHLGVPDTVERVSVALSGGNVNANGIAASVSAKTRGGDIGLYDIPGGFSAKTMGGNVIIRLHHSPEGNAKASTMGGNIALEIPEGARAIVSGRTMGGEVTVQEGMPVEEEAAHMASSAASIDLSEGEEAPRIALRTMGGNISVARTGSAAEDGAGGETSEGGEESV